MGREKARHTSTLEIRKLIGKNIARYRDLAGLEQHELACLALGYMKNRKNAAQKAISSLETGAKEPLASELNALSKVLTVRMGDFFNDSEHIDPRIQARLKTILPRLVPT